MILKNKATHKGWKKVEKQAFVISVSYGEKWTSKFFFKLILSVDVFFFLGQNALWELILAMNDFSWI